MTKHQTLFLSLQYPLLVPLTAFFIIGILWATTGYSFIIPSLGFALTFIIKTLQKKGANNSIRALLLTPLAFFSGVFLYTTKIKTQEVFYDQVHNKSFDIIATIQSIKKTNNRAHNQTIIIKTKKIKEENTKEWKDISKNILIYTKNQNNIQVDDTVKIKNITCKKPQGSSYSLYLTKEGIALSIFAPKAQCKILDRPSNSLKRWIHTKRANITESIKRKMAPNTFEMFSSIFLGNRKTEQEFTQGLKNKCKRWGILHFLARSGLHLIMFLLLCQMILKLIPIHLSIKQCITITLTIVYLLLSWPSISFIRAFSVCILYKICPFLHIKPDLTYAVSLVALIVLLFNPTQLFFIGFQLSFTLTLILALVHRVHTQKGRRAKLLNKKYT